MQTDCTAKHLSFEGTGRRTAMGRFGAPLRTAAMERPTSLVHASWWRPRRAFSLSQLWRVLHSCD